MSGPSTVDKANILRSKRVRTAPERFTVEESGQTTTTTKRKAKPKSTTANKVTKKTKKDTKKGTKKTPKVSTPQTIERRCPGPARSLK